MKMRIQPKNVWDMAKTILTGKFIALHAYLRKQARTQINNLTTLKRTEKITTNKALSE